MSTPLEIDYLKRILRAPVYDIAQRTPLHHARRLSTQLGPEIWLKREDLQSIFSFKIRGAYCCMKQLDAAALQQGVIAVSAGNHAQGVALAARQLNAPACIVMPCTTPGIKVENVRHLGAEVILHGDQYDQAQAFAQQLATERGLTLIHPFDDPWVIAGQGTIGMEIMQDCPQVPDAIYIPVGGGGLIAGIASYCKAVYPDTQIIGVEPEDAASLNAALQAGKRVRIEQAGLFADGVAVKQVGRHPFNIAKRLVDRMVTVSTDEICHATQDIFQDTRALVEPAGALAVAGINKDCRLGYWQNSKHNETPHLVAINSGANTNFERLGHVVERAAYGSGQEALLAVSIPEQPGAFLNFCRSLGQHIITEFNYRYKHAFSAQVFVGIKSVSDISKLIQNMRSQNLEVVDLSDNELAKVHLRHMVGGSSPSPLREVLYRFEFPARPGALLEFLEALSCNWNISLFHYRNHGAANLRVLAGFHVPQQEQEQFEQFRLGLPFPSWCENNNPAYQYFLAHHAHSPLADQDQWHLATNRDWHLGAHNAIIKG